MLRSKIYIIYIFAEIYMKDLSQRHDILGATKELVDETVDFSVNTCKLPFYDYYFQWKWTGEKISKAAKIHSIQFEKLSSGSRL